ncbi:hypothetical protein FD31_GL001717 [Companilactobacillus nantensis DSM 16982]|uniref:DUF3955 domain-containing protein n=2 Tax=Companilactobacillus nantensis TaxID=305793 RepID=A0A0R1W9M9_9LACO|nr:hypothetical protein FD31_GL001717 [Companilactobacillus nantensis DSM 16982]
MDDEVKQMRKAKLSWYTMIAALLIAVGCFVSMTLIESTVDSNGILHEPFFLIPIGYLFLLIGLISGAIHWYQRSRQK